MDGNQSPLRTKYEVLKSDMNPKCGQSHLTITSPRKNNSVEKKSNEANQIALHTTKKLPVQNGVKIYKMIRMPKYRRWSITLAHHTHACRYYVENPNTHQPTNRLTCYTLLWV